MTTISSGAFVRLSNPESRRNRSMGLLCCRQGEPEYGALEVHCASTHNRPPWATMMDRQIASPIPTPLVFVV